MLLLLIGLLVTALGAYLVTRRGRGGGLERANSLASGVLVVLVGLVMVGFGVLDLVS